MYPTSRDGVIDSSWVKNQVESSNDIFPFSELANFIFGGFNNHIVHHLFPQIHHVYYPEINRVIYPLLVDYNLKVNHQSYISAIISHLKLLRKMGEKPSS